MFWIQLNLQGFNLAYDELSDARIVHLKGMFVIRLHIPIEATLDVKDAERGKHKSYFSVIQVALCVYMYFSKNVNEGERVTIMVIVIDVHGNVNHLIMVPRKCIALIRADTNGREKHKLHKQVYCID